MRSYPCMIVGMSDEGRAAYVKQHVQEGDEIVLQRQPGNAGEADAVACFHGRQCIGHIPHGRSWVSRSLAAGDSHLVRVTGFDANDAGELISLEIEITILGEERPGSDPGARSMISEIGDELRILAMVAAADGRIAAPERALLEDFAARRAQEAGVVPKEGEIQHAVRWARRKAADSLDAAQIIGRLATERPAALQPILDECELMAEIDGTVGQQERQIVTTLRTLLHHGIKMAKDRSG
jgi:tellurite resistance protein